MPELPALNAGLNALAAILLSLGWYCILKRRIAIHKACMIAAFVVSMVFLASYLYYHIVVKSGQPTRFSGVGVPKTIYFAILISHTTLAVLIAILAPVTLVLGLKAPGNRHAALARWTMPIWLYVSVTGVVVYLMLYHLYPAAG